MLVFAHVPKTGGTSITAILLRFLTACGVPAENVLLYGTMIPYTDLAPLKQLPGSIRFLAGHFREPHYEQLLPHQPFVLVSSREPFGRFCSGIEHFERVRRDGVRNLVDFERTSALMAGLERCRGSRQGICEVLLRYQQAAESNRALRRILLYQNRFVADARIESTEIEQLCEMLATQTPKTVIDFATLKGVSHQNVWPRIFFNRFTSSEHDLLRECFEECFRDTIELLQEFHAQTPSLFTPEHWERFCQQLCPPDTAALPKILARQCLSQ